MNAFGSKDYAFEELIAEMGSAFLMGSFGLGGELRHTDYIGHWSELLNKDPEALMRAATAAQKAVDYMVDPYIEHARVREEGEKPCDCRQCKPLRELYDPEAFIFPLEVWEKYWIPETGDEEE